MPTYASTISGGVQSATLTLSSIVATGTDVCLTLAVATRGTPVVTSVVFNGSENFTQQGTAQIGNATIHFYTLVNPTSTTADVVITNTNTLRMAAACSVYTNVDQTTPVRSGTVQTATGTGTAPAVSVTGTSGDLLVDACSIVANGPPTLTAAHTERANLAQTGGSTDVGLGCQELSATGGADSMSWTAGSSTDWAMASFALVSASGGGGPVQTDITLSSTTSKTLEVETKVNYVRTIEYTSSKSVTFAKGLVILMTTSMSTAKSLTTIPESVLGILVSVATAKVLSIQKQIGKLLTTSTSKVETVNKAVSKTLSVVATKAVVAQSGLSFQITLPYSTSKSLVTMPVFQGAGAVILIDDIPTMKIGIDTLGVLIDMPTQIGVGACDRYFNYQRKFYKASYTDL